jgi:hypothetical protein
MACPEKHNLSDIQRLRIKSTKATSSRDWGTSWHEVTDAYDKMLFNGGSIDAAVDSGLQHAFSLKEKLPLDDSPRSLQSLCRAIVWYGEEARHDKSYVLANPDGSPAIEIRGEVPIPGTKYRLSFRVDRLVHEDGSNWIRDRKTTASSLDKWYFQQFLNDNQKYAYIWALKNQMGMDVAGFQIDACQTLKGSTRFARRDFTVTPEQIEEWLLDMKAAIEGAEISEARGRWERRFTSCNMYNGCDYRPICSAVPHVRAARLEDMYKKRS